MTVATPRVYAVAHFFDDTPDPTIRYRDYELFADGSVNLCSHERDTEAGRMDFFDCPPNVQRGLLAAVEAEGVSIDLN